MILEQKKRKPTVKKLKAIYGKFREKRLIQEES